MAELDKHMRAKLLERMERPTTAQYISDTLLEKAGRRVSELAMIWFQTGDYEAGEQQQKFGRQVRNVRLRSGLDFATFVSRTGLDLDQVVLLESGLLSAVEVAQVLDKVVAALGVPLAEISTEPVDSNDLTEDELVNE